ncbi:MAG: hypothetical protein ACI4MK_02800 [Aristaeellaceae bacterium]
MKNAFVVTAALVSRAANQGGLSYEDAFTLSDAYIQKCELITTLERITNLQYHMALKFTEWVERLRFGGKSTPLTRLWPIISSIICPSPSGPSASPGKCT